MNAEFEKILEDTMKEKRLYLDTFRVDEPALTG